MSSIVSTTDASGALLDASGVALSESKMTRVINSLVTHVGEAGGDPFPSLNRIWDMFATKGIRTVFLSVGASKAALADLEIAESLGCPLNVVPIGPTESAAWSEVSAILKERKRDAATATPFSAEAEKKWILPKNLRVYETVPWWENGTIDISGTVLQAKYVKDVVTAVTTPMKLTDAGNRIDILKVDTTGTAPGLERSVIGAVLSAGYRPSVVIVNWSQMPDVELSATIAAGHLQNCGYSLMGKLGSKFLYYFSDEDLYQLCSWEGISINNPITTEIAYAARNPAKSKMTA